MSDMKSKNKTLKNSANQRYTDENFLIQILHNILKKD